MGQYTLYVCGRSERRVSPCPAFVRAKLTSVDLSDLALVDWLSGGKVDLTFGS